MDKKYGLNYTQAEIELEIQELLEDPELISFFRMQRKYEKYHNLVNILKQINTQPKK